jgi:hypothetical protein
MRLVTSIRCGAPISAAPDAVKFNRRGVPRSRDPTPAPSPGRCAHRRNYLALLINNFRGMKRNSAGYRGYPCAQLVAKDDSDRSAGQYAVAASGDSNYFWSRETDKSVEGDERSQS